MMKRSNEKQNRKNELNVSLCARKGLYAKDIAQEIGISYKNTQRILSKHKIKYKKQQRGITKPTPSYIKRAKVIIKKAKNVLQLKEAYEYISNNVPKEEDDEILDLLLDKQKEIRDAYEKSKVE